MSVLGVQGWLHIGGGPELVRWAIQHKPPILKILDPRPVPDDVHRYLRESLPDTVIVWRIVDYFDHRQYVLGLPPDQARAAAAAHFEELMGRGGYLRERLEFFDILELLNEPGAVHYESLAAYEEEFARRAQAAGLFVAGMMFSTGNPPEGIWEKTRTLRMPPNFVFAPHEYAYERDGKPDPQWGWHMMRYPKWVPSNALVYIGETGLEPGGYRRWGAGPLMEILTQYDERLQADPRVLGAAIFVWNGEDWGWSGFAIWREPAILDWLAARYRESPPVYRRGLLLRQAPSIPPAPAYRCGDILEVTTNLRLRAGPGLRHETIRVMGRGELVLLQKMEYADGVWWGRVVPLKDMRGGYCSLAYTRLYLRPCAG